MKPRPALAGPLFSWYDDDVRRVIAGTVEDVRRVARKYIRTESTVAVVVGDVQRIRSGIERLALGPIVQRKP